MRRGNIGKPADRISQHLAVVSHVRCPHLEQVVESARDHVAAFHLRNAPGCSIELVKHIGCGTFECDLNKGNIRQSEIFRREFGPVAPYQAGFFKPLDPLRTGSFGEADSM